MSALMSLSEIVSLATMLNSDDLERLKRAILMELELRGANLDSTYSEGCDICDNPSPGGILIGSTGTRCVPCHVAAIKHTTAFAPADMTDENGEVYPPDPVKA